MATTTNIRPYLNEEDDNMGLLKYRQVLFDNIFHEEPLTCLEQYGRRRYVTGLDEYAPEVDKIENADEKAAKILQIRKHVVFLEQRFGGNQHLKVDDANFWANVQVVGPGNDVFWKEVKLICGNQPIPLNPSEEPMDLIKLLAIEAGGFSIIATSLDEARKAGTPPKFYLDKLQDTMALTTETKKLRNKAGALLDKLFEKDQSKLFYVAKAIDANSVQYRKKTHADVQYNNLDLFLDGQLDGNLNKRKNIDRFLTVAALDMETLRLAAIVKDATFSRFISARSDGGIYETESHAMMGKNQAEVVEFLKSPLNDNILRTLTDKVEALWA